jgi:hypothetical protein
LRVVTADCVGSQTRYRSKVFGLIAKRRSKGGTGVAFGVLAVGGGSSTFPRGREAGAMFFHLHIGRNGKKDVHLQRRRRQRAAAPQCPLSVERLEDRMLLSTAEVDGLALPAAPPSETPGYKPLVCIFLADPESIDVNVRCNCELVVESDATLAVAGGRTETVDKNETITIHANRTETVDNNETLSLSISGEGTAGAAMADGGTDGIWIDLGFPALTAADGQKFKPLFAFYVEDLDGRVNVSLATNIVDYLDEDYLDEDQISRLPRYWVFGTELPAGGAEVGTYAGAHILYQDVVIPVTRERQSATLQVAVDPNNPNSELAAIDSFFALEANTRNGLVVAGSC